MLLMSVAVALKRERSSARTLCMRYFATRNMLAIMCIINMTASIIAIRRSQRTR